jgi:hypothetical protein
MIADLFVLYLLYVEDKPNPSPATMYQQRVELSSFVLAFSFDCAKL